MNVDYRNSKNTWLTTFKTYLT